MQPSCSSFRCFNVSILSIHNQFQILSSLQYRTAQYRKPRSSELIFRISYELYLQTEPRSTGNLAVPGFFFGKFWPSGTARANCIPNTSYFQSRIDLADGPTHISERSIVYPPYADSGLKSISKIHVMNRAARIAACKPRFLP